VLAALTAGDAAAALAALKTAHVAYSEHRAGVDETVKVSTSFADAATAMLAATQSNLSRAQSIVFALSAALLIALGVWARKTVWSATGGEPADVAAIANAVAQGDLSVHVPVGAGDSASVMAAMARMRDKLSGIVGQVRSSS